MQVSDPVKFYDYKDQEWGFLANFYPSQFQQNGIKYQTNEHYFQSKKFVGSTWQLQIAKIQTPAKAFDMGQSRQYPLRKDWNQKKQQVMLNGLRLKFTQNPQLKQKLLNTGNRQIIQHTSHDSYWGDGLGTGLNRLGVLFMQLREEFRNKQAK